MVKHCERCNKVLGVFSEKYYFNPKQFGPSFPFYRKKEGNLLCVECYDKIMEEAGWEISYSKNEYVDKIVYTKSYQKSIIKKHPCRGESIK